MHICLKFGGHPVGVLKLSGSYMADVLRVGIYLYLKGKVRTGTVKSSYIRKS